MNTLNSLSVQIECLVARQLHCPTQTFTFMHGIFFCYLGKSELFTQFLELYKETTVVFIGEGERHNCRSSSLCLWSCEFKRLNKQRGNMITEFGFNYISLTLLHYYNLYEVCAESAVL